MTDNALLDLHTSGTEQRTLSPIEGILGSGFRLDSTDVPILDLLLRMTSPSAVHLHFCKLGGLLGSCQKLIDGIGSKLLQIISFYQLNSLISWHTGLSFLWQRSGAGTDNQQVNLSVGARVDGRLSLGVSRAMAWRPARHLTRRSPYGSWDGLQTPWMDAFVLF